MFVCGWRKARPDAHVSHAHLPVYRIVLETSSKPIPEAIIANPA